ncbi:hypothetical protein O6H91_05G044900 [Diphasiastrum complanatum]|uniref:Uncharacterized protein n=1 Tax=Diphasiastrum complanatum TaxID=34168 RepID=A0ACC2DMS5_DIPCM|nr:hypothetical protein O6H91_05G044900 [Diphasiastrum complanatum]
MLNQGKGRPQYGAISKSLTHLPPKSPFFATSSAHLDSFPGSRKGHLRSSIHDVGYEKYENDSEIIPPTEPSWLNELLDSPKVSQRRFSHRRSASDTVAFLEAPSNFTKIGGIAEEDEFTSPSKPPARLRGSLDFDRLDEEQFAHMFSHLELVENLPCKDERIFSQAHKAATTGVSRSTSQSWTPESKMISSNFDASTSELKNYCLDVFHEDMKAARGRCVNGGPEVERARVGESYDSDQLLTSWDTDVDPELQQPKRLSNRQSAQRSRVRKLQYIAELERRVNVLQTEVSNLSLQVTYLDHQRTVLSADNKALKQRITGVLKDKQFKDAHIEVMKKESQKLRMILYQQKSQLVSHLQQQVSGSELNAGLLQNKETSPVTDAFVRLVKASSIAPNTQGIGVAKGWAGNKVSAVMNAMPSS